MKQKRRWPLILAIVLNGAILIALFWSFQVYVPTAGNAPVQADLISGSGPEATPAPAPAQKSAPAPAPAPAPK
ncbi:MAG: protein TolA, partial [Gammaproteobacteria bacterium]|nr:protein TolA [Gammaproteobacteria bacterium]